MDKMLRRSLVLVILFVSCILTGGVEAAILEAGPSGYPYTSIQAAINAAITGDTVLVHDGTYVENINFSGKAITVKSVNGAASTIIDGNGSGRVVTFNYGEGSGSVLDGFTITNGGAGWGGGIYCGGSFSPSMKNTILWGDAPNEIYLEGSSITVTYSDVNQDGYAGSSGNIRQAPLFVDPANGNFRLQLTSPCIDAATSDGAPLTDMKGNPRFNAPWIPNTGEGTYPYYDMGAFELAISKPMVDFDGDMKTDITIYRPSLKWWIIRPSTNPSAPYAVKWGAADDIPIPQDNAARFFQ